VNNPVKPSRWLWPSIALPPVIWIAQLILLHSLTPVFCRQKRLWMVHVISADAAQIVGVLLGGSAREWGRSARRKPEAETFAATEAVAQGQFLAVVAVMTSTFFLMLIIALAMPPILLDPCHGWEAPQ
jgi:hypothetical protein